MTDDEFTDSFMGEVLQLFPKGEITASQMKQWQARVRRLPLGEALSILSDYYAEPNVRKYGTPPSLEGFLAHARRATGDAAPTGQAKLPSRADVIRAQFPEFAQYSDADAIMAHEQRCFEQALVVYGPASSDSEAAYNRWQKEVARAGGPVMAYDRDYWTEEYNRHRGDQPSFAGGAA